jgi:hypothetical protein
VLEGSSSIETLSTAKQTALFSLQCVERAVRIKECLTLTALLMKLVHAALGYLHCELCCLNDSTVLNKTVVVEFYSFSRCLSCYSDSMETTHSRVFEWEVNTRNNFLKLLLTTWMRRVNSRNNLWKLLLITWIGRMHDIMLYWPNFGCTIKTKCEWFISGYLEYVTYVWPIIWHRKKTCEWFMLLIFDLLFRCYRKPKK